MLYECLLRLYAIKLNYSASKLCAVNIASTYQYESSLLNEVNFYLCACIDILLASEFRSPLTVCWDFKGWFICTTITFVFIIHFASITNKTERWTIRIKSRSTFAVINNCFFGVLNEWILLGISEREQEAL
jgi:hypothetical protein